MKTINIHEARTHLSRLIAQVVASGEPFVIARAGKPLVKVVPLEVTPTGRVQRLGFLSGQITVPEDFDQMGKTQIGRLFFGEEA
ncbi:MAG: type II toxin-antitoxin system prevent-host-death family antitoxin [Bryobacteraceae bacterium]